MLEEAGAGLKAGVSVVLDAAFLKLAERSAAEALAARMAIPFQGLWMEAPEALLRERLDARTGDASDADGAVLDHQLSREVGEIGWRRIDAAAPASRPAGRRPAHLKLSSGTICTGWPQKRRGV